VIDTVLPVLSTFLLARFCTDLLTDLKTSSP
jgi:hypothetical protein